MKLFWGTVIVLGLGLQTAVAQNFSAALADPSWDGKELPAGQHCSKFGGKGAPPPLRVEGIPAGANAILVEFNDRSYHQLSTDGGRGKIAFELPAGAASASLPAVPGETDSLPAGAVVHKRNRATGSYATAGYLPPCSGGRGNAYFADVLAVELADGKIVRTLAKARVELGRY